MSLSLDDEIQSDDSGGFDKRMMEASDAVLRSPIYEEMSSSTSSVSDSSTILLSREDFVCRGKILNCERVILNRQGRCDGLGDGRRSRVQRVKVRQNKKRLKELSAVFIGQDIQAHQYSILTMKFSQDGRYLATVGEDGYSLCITY
ncbi:hypothetical protein LXL04_002162 [Taraxacum kok-saghyz]